MNKLKISRDEAFYSYLDFLLKTEPGKTIKIELIFDINRYISDISGIIEENKEEIKAKAIDFVMNYCQEKLEEEYSCKLDRVEYRKGGA